MFRGVVLFCLFSVFVFRLPLRAQEVIPTSQQSVYFYYQEIGLTNRYEPRILLISTHIYRLKEVDEPRLVPISDALETRFDLGFHSILEKIKVDERVQVDNEYLAFKGTITARVKAFYNGFRSESAGPEVHTIFENTTEHILAMREQLIDLYRRDGYQILQIDTRPYLRDELSSEFTQYVDFIYPLSPVEIEVYRTGRIRTTLESVAKKEKPAKKEDSSKKKEEFSLVELCLYAKERVYSYIVAAQRKPSLDSWTRAKNEYESFLAGCGTTGVAIPEDWKNQIAAGYATSFTVEGAKSVYETFTEIPWTYGYGQFLDAENKNYFHRFGFGGMSGTFNPRKVIGVDFSMVMNFARLPSYMVYYGFEDQSGNAWNSVSDSSSAENLGFAAISIGPKISIWPQKNIFLRFTPEVYVGFNNGTSWPVPVFTGFPGLFAEGGVRIGKVYLSAGYGMLWKGFEVDPSSSYARKSGRLSHPFWGEIQGDWIVESFADGSMRQHRYFLFSLGLDL